MREARLRGTTIARVGTTPGLGLYGHATERVDVREGREHNEAAQVLHDEARVAAAEHELGENVSMVAWWAQGRQVQRARAQRRGGAGAAQRRRGRRGALCMKECGSGGGGKAVHGEGA